MEKRVVITGMGAITPIGKNVKENWEAILNKKCGIDEITLLDTTNFKTKLAGEIKDYKYEDYFDFKTAKRLDRSSQFAMIAAREAFEDSGITKENTDFEVKNHYILIEKAIKDKCNVIIAPDGIIGNIIFRTLVLVNSWPSCGAVTFGINSIYIDTSRDQNTNGYLRSLKLAYKLANI